MKIALCQLDIIYEQKDKNLENAELYMARATAAGADMILFPEMSFTGFSMNVDLTGESAEDSYTKDRMAKLARQYHLAAGFGWVRAGEAKSFLAQNIYTVLDEEGKCLGEYAKIHPFTYGGESQFFRGGDALCIFPYKNHQIALSICYDLRFPELYQALSDTAGILITAANWPAVRQEQWKVLLQARAIENQAYMLGINCCGMQGELLYTGGSAAFSPYGKDILTSDSMCEDADFTLFYADIGEEAWDYRREFPVRQDRLTPICIFPDERKK